MNIAIVTTLRDAEHTLNSFIRYHLKIGVDFIYLFFDNKSDTSIEIAKVYSQVRIFLPDENLRNKWTNATLYHRYQKYTTSEVMARQVLNLEIALDEALNDGIDWLINIDIDELIFTPQKSIKSTFKKYDILGFNNLRFLNYEAVPHKMIIMDFFKEVTVFKKNPFLLNTQQLEFCNNQPAFNSGVNYFWFYRNGKSAAKVNDNLLPNGVHSFTPQDKYTVCNDAIILHYAICGFDHFLAKYSTLKNFKNNWFGNYRIPLKMHLKSRDIVNNESINVAREFYYHEVMKLNKIVDEALDMQMFQKITYPSELLN